MSVQRSLVPDPLRPGVGVVLCSTWSVGTPERQEATVEAITKAWESRAWPHEGLLSYSVFVDEDGDTLRHYSQWRDLDTYEEFFAAARNGRDARNADIDAAVPGIERLGLHRYELYRSGVREDAGQREPGCVVTVEVEFDGPDPQRQRDWIDTVFEAMEGDATPHPGGIAAYFHVSLDGTRVLNYATWDSAQDHKDAVAPIGDGTLTAPWRRVRDYPGVVGGAVRRHRPAVSFSAG